ncbi:MAG: hypothetical protein ABR606_03815 [Vicinamibacterales bacterium]
MSTLRFRTAGGFIHQEQIGMECFGKRDGRSFAKIQIIRAN